MEMFDEYQYTPLAMIMAVNGVFFSGDLIAFRTANGVTTSPNTFGVGDTGCVINGSWDQYGIFCGFDMKRSQYHGYNVFLFKKHMDGFFCISEMTLGLIQFKVVKSNQEKMINLTDIPVFHMFTDPKYHSLDDAPVENPYFIPSIHQVSSVEIFKKRKQDVHNLIQIRNINQSNYGK